jgi:T4 RnlA family RNA ligase
MNELQTKLYKDLMTLVDTDEAFFYADSVLDDANYRIFNYRLASYSQWLNDGALECRGVTFEVDDNGDARRLVSWPFGKFFNLNENPFVMDLDLTKVTHVYDKMDGSLISSMVLPDRTMWLKSKGSLFSSQAQAANKLIRQPEHKKLLKFVEGRVRNEFTVIMEYTAPDNRIVVPYDKPALTILGVRCNDTGSDIDLDHFRYDRHDPADSIEEYLVPIRKYDATELLQTLDEMKGIEGFIFVFEDGMRVKIKTEEYRVLHKVKDSINSKKQLFEACVYDAADEIRALFYDDAQAIALIDEMEGKVNTIYNHMVDTVERFYERNKGLERKDYAILGQKELESIHFGLAMNKYIGRPVEYKDAMVKNRISYGVKDDPVVPPS